MRETWVQYLGCEDPLEKGTASCLENSMDREAWQAIYSPWGSKSRTRLSNFHLFFVSEVMSLLFNTFSRFSIAFLLRSKSLLISWLQSPSAVIFGVQENSLSLGFHCFPIYLPWSDGNRCHDSVSLLLLLSRFSRVRLYATPWTAAYQASLSMGFSRQEHWSGLPFPSPSVSLGLHIILWKWK